MLEDKLLVWRIKHGSKEALCQIYEKYRDDLLRIAAGLLNETGAAEDVVHDVFVSFVECSRTFRLTGSLKGYLVACVANRARTKNRSLRVRNRVLPDRTDTADPDSGNPEFAAVFGEELRQLSAALERLPYEQREVLILRSHGGMKFKAIARQQGVSINTAQGRYRYALDRLRSMLNGEARE